MKYFEKKITVNNPNGVHSRVATKLAQIASENEVKLNIIYCDHVVDCSSVLDVLSMAFIYGSSFIVRADGELSIKALCEVEKLFTRVDV